jgi:hypothetical protein
MYRLAYRRFSDHDVLTVTHSVAAGSTIGVRWYELRDPATAPKIYQQGTYSPDPLARWMGSVAMDKAGDLIVGYSASAQKTFPAIRYAGRTAADPLGSLSAEVLLTPGKGSQQSPDRWGDYTSVSVDPVDDCTFWFTAQYLGATGTYNWNTSIARVRFDNCK